MKSITLTLIRRVSVSKLATCRIQGLIPDYTHFLQLLIKVAEQLKDNVIIAPLQCPDWLASQLVLRR